MAWPRAATYRASHGTGSYRSSGRCTGRRHSGTARRVRRPPRAARRAPSRSRFPLESVDGVQHRARRRRTGSGGCRCSRSASPRRDVVGSRAWTGRARLHELAALRRPGVSLVGRQRHLSGDRRPASRRRLDLERAADEREALAHAERGRARRRGHRPASKPRPSSSIVAATLRPRCETTMLTCSARRVLDDVRERLLDDAVERRLDLGREALLEVASRRSSRCRFARENVCGEPLERRARGRSRRAPTGRSSTASARTSWSAWTTSARTSASARSASSSLVGAPIAFRPSRIDVNAWPVSSCSSSASRRRSSSCAVDDAPHGVARDALRQRDGDRCAGGEDLGETQVAVGEARVRGRACRAPR